MSLFVHVVILTALAAATFTAKDETKKPANFDSALAGYRQGEQEQLNIWADPANIPRDQAIGNEHGGSAPTIVEMAGDGGGEGDDGGGAIVASEFEGRSPSVTPRFKGTGKKGINEGNSLPNNISIGGMQAVAAEYAADCSRCRPVRRRNDRWRPGV